MLGAEVMKIAARDNAVSRRQLMRRKVRSVAQAIIDRIKILITVGEKLLEAFDDEICLLEIADDVIRSHDAFEVEGDAVRRGIFQRKDRLRRRGHDSSPENAQPFRRLDQAELNRVPVEPREIVELPARQRPSTAFSIGFEKTRIRRIGEERHMPEDVMEDVGLLQIFELRLRANEGAGRKAPIGEMIEEGVVRNQPGHRNDAPAGHGPQSSAKIRELRNAGARQFELLLRRQELVAGPAGQERRLAGEQPVPTIVLLIAVGGPVLIYRPVRLSRRLRVSILAFVRELQSHRGCPSWKPSLSNI
ncbi:MAG: hypothetical protein FD139_2132 [Methylocystaceae bacterium]|nr:MAG: hypothetical protein FD139_2132 [Methylocystaceae bacterium]